MKTQIRRFLLKFINSACAGVFFFLPARVVLYCLNFGSRLSSRTEVKSFKNPLGLTEFVQTTEILYTPEIQNFERNLDALIQSKLNKLRDI